MGRIKINDLAEDPKISKEEMRKVFGGGIVAEDLIASPQQQYSLTPRLPSIPRLGWNLRQIGY